MEDRYRQKILVTVYICMLAFAMVFQSLPPVLKFIIDELQIAHAHAGLLMSLFALLGTFSPIEG